MATSSHVLYAYAIPDREIRDRRFLADAAVRFVESREWVCPDAWAVDQELIEGGAQVGINLCLPELYAGPAGWFSDVEAIVSFCVESRTRLGQDFVIGVFDTIHSEDIIEMDSNSPDVQFLEKFLGTAPPEDRANDA